MDTRSAELLSATVVAAMSLSLLLSDASRFAQVMAGYLPDWAIVGLLCSAVSFFGIWVNDNSVKMLSRFLSGCVWGTVVMVYIAHLELSAVFWCAMVMFLFDVFSVIYKGRIVWTRRSHF